MNKHLYKNWYVEESLGYKSVVYNNEQCSQLFTNISGSLFANYLYTNQIYPSNVGNSVKVRSASFSSSIAELYIADGTYKVSAYIGDGNASIGSDTIELDTTAFNTYELSLLDGDYKFYINGAMVAEGSATSSSDTPISYFGFYDNPFISDVVYVSYISSGRYVTKSYVVGDWGLNDISKYTQTTFSDVSCGKLSALEDESSAYFYKNEVSADTVGNTLFAKVALGVDEDTQQTSGPFQLCISDGTYMVVADISEDNVAVATNSFTLDTTVFHDYWLTLKDGKYQLFVDKELVLTGNASSSVSRFLSVGFTRLPNDYDFAYIKYIKNVQGEKRPIDLSKVSCEVQVDTADTFDSVNLKTYYSVDNLVFAKQDGTAKVFIDVNNDNNNTSRSITITLDGVSGSAVSIAANATATSIANSLYTSGVPTGWTATLKGTRVTLIKSGLLPLNHATDEYNYLTVTGDSALDVSLEIFHRGTALGTGIVRSFTIPLLPRQEDSLICYFFRVRVNNEYYTSDWAYYFYDEPAVDIVFSTKEQLSNNKYIIDRLVAFCYENRKSYMLIKTPTAEDMEEGYIAIKDSTAIWKPIINSYFILDSNNTNNYFNQVYNFRMPDYEVYTKYDYSGNIANAISSEATIIDIADFEIKNSTRDLDVHLCRDNYLYNNFGSLYRLAEDYFNTVNEYRDTLVNIIDGYCNPGNTKVLKNILAGITGAEPYIEELKNTKKWILWDRVTMLTKPDSERYVLFDPQHPYTKKNKAVLYTAQGKAFTFNIHLYNPLGLKINTDMIKIIVELFKPSFSQANIIFYNEEGLPVVYPAEYYFSNYGQGLYYTEDTSEEA